jgi:hypothetical protein
MPEIKPALRLTPRRFFAGEERARRARERNPYFAMHHQARIERVPRINLRANTLRVSDGKQFYNS